MPNPIALVVYDAADPLITRIAEQFAGNLTSPEPATLLDANAGTQPSWDEVRLLVVGTPTADRGPSLAVEAWLDGVEPPARRLAIAAFDTRQRGGWLRKGNAAGRVSKRLDRAGFLPSMGTETFYLDPSGDQLEAGELERASTWAYGLGIATGTQGSKK